MMGKASMADFSAQPILSIPVPFKYGFAFDWQAFLPIALSI
ncbi:xanthine permease [Vibrio maritimus]|uniref:Xanthine permease n=1 Tax=Vibrio maritimus TaxID=990268 RepID=A0A090RVZ4_9VIBR|nr:xanthine permease [Vibrio maritimus]